MLDYVGRIEDFWSEELENYHFPHRVNAGQRDYFHPNFSRPVNDLQQGFDDELPSCGAKFFEALKVSRGSISWTCLNPCQIIPVHTDAFYRLRTQYSVDIENCLRYIIFLQPWVLGHTVEFEEKTIIKWTKGDVWKFDYRSKHWAGNASNINFITCQVNTF